MRESNVAPRVRRADIALGASLIPRKPALNPEVIGSSRKSALSPHPNLMKTPPGILNETHSKHADFLPDPNLAGGLRPQGSVRAGELRTARGMEKRREISQRHTRRGPFPLVETLR